MKSDSLLLIIAIVAVVVSVVGAGITYSYINTFNSKLTGFAAQSGDINLTVESTALVNFTTEQIDWGTGQVDSGQENATLDTSAAGNNVTNGNWTGNTAGLVIENIGNSNLSINISATKDAAGLVGGTSPTYKYNVTFVEDFSCLNSTGSAENAGDLAMNITEGVFVPVNTTKITWCDVFPFEDLYDTIRIDVQLVIPSDSLTGALGDIFSVQIAAN